MFLAVATAAAAAGRHLAGRIPTAAATARVRVRVRGTVGGRRRVVARFVHAAWPMVYTTDYPEQQLLALVLFALEGNEASGALVYLLNSSCLGPRCPPRLLPIARSAHWGRGRRAAGGSGPWSAAAAEPVATTARRRLASGSTVVVFGVGMWMPWLFTSGISLVVCIIARKMGNRRRIREMVMFWFAARDRGCDRPKEYWGSCVIGTQVRSTSGR